jgi:hypothetical protein
MSGESVPSRRARGWPLRRYMMLFVVVLIVVGSCAAIFVRLQAEADARQGAAVDASFAAHKAATQLQAGFDFIQSTSMALSADPSLPKLFADPSRCLLGYAPIAAFDTGHVDLLRLDGSIMCTSLKPKQQTGLAYQGQAWLQATAPVVLAPNFDAATSNQVVVIAYPLPRLGMLVWFIDLQPIGPKLASEFGSGTHQLEFVVVGQHGT